MKKRPASFQRALFKAFFVVTLAALTAAVPAGCGKTETDSSSDEGATFEIDFGTTGASAEELAAGSFASSLPASEFSAEAAGIGETGETALQNSPQKRRESGKPRLPRPEKQLLKPQPA